LAAVACAHVDCHLTYLLKYAHSKTAASLYSSGSRTPFAQSTVFLAATAHWTFVPTTSKFKTHAR